MCIHKSECEGCAVYLFSCCHWSLRAPPGNNGASYWRFFSSDGPSWWRSATQSFGDTLSLFPPGCSLPSLPVSQSLFSVVHMDQSLWEFQTWVDHHDDSGSNLPGGKGGCITLLVLRSHLRRPVTLLVNIGWVLVCVQHPYYFCHNCVMTKKI